MYGLIIFRNRPLPPHLLLSWASYQIRKIAGCACAGNAGNIFPTHRVSDPHRHHGTCVTHVPWCIPGSLTSGFLWSRCRGKRSWQSRRMRNPQFYVSGKRPMTEPKRCLIHYWPNYGVHKARWKHSYSTFSFAGNGWVSTRKKYYDFYAAIT